MKNASLFFPVLAIVAAVLIAGCSEAPPPSLPRSATPVPQGTAITISGTIGTGGSPYGTILVDPRGKALYSFADDIPGSGTSACTGPCAALWPAIFADTTKVASPLIPADFGSITRADGSRQTTYHGRPLYYFSQDTKAGIVSGENYQNLWFVVRPNQRVHVAHREDLGLFLTDGDGRTLYYTTKDSRGTSTCNDTCIARYPAFCADPLTAPSLLEPADFSAVTREDGKKQTAYRGRPLYSYAGDTRPGEVNGLERGGTWHVADVAAGALS